MKIRCCFLINIFFAALFCSNFLLRANNVTVEDVTIASVNNTNDYAIIEFDVSWENSWKINSEASNWDAVWLFIKFRESGGEWGHATLDQPETAPDGAEITVTSDAKGAFAYRDDLGSGNIDWDNIQLRWEYGIDGVADAANVEVKVFAIEMVYVTEGAFYLGKDGYNHFYQPYPEPTVEEYYKINSEGEIEVANEHYKLWYRETNQHAGDRQGPIPAAFPKGYHDFYCMKYEVSQGQYAEFLSMLTDNQDNNRYPNLNGNYRHTISGSFSNYSASAPERACNYLSWADATAYADWAALRPMTELEFVKACRGKAPGVAGEYPWGNSNIAGLPYTLSNDGADNENISSNYSTSAGNISYSETDGSINGPLRCGIFAANENNSGRITSGASRYGIMQLGGNVGERIVTVGHPSGRSYTGLHGDGVLTEDGYANVLNWPGSGGPTSLGSGFMGGSFGSGSGQCQVSGRNEAARNYPDRHYLWGFRAVRTAP